MTCLQTCRSSNPPQKGGKQPRSRLRGRGSKTYGFRDGALGFVPEVGVEKRKGEKRSRISALPSKMRRDTGWIPFGRSGPFSDNFPTTSPGRMKDGSFTEESQGTN